MYFDDVPFDDEDDNFGGWRSGLRWHDDPPTETAPLGGGDIAPLPTYDNPNK